jgi:hypothetical protein
MQRGRELELLRKEIAEIDVWWVLRGLAYFSFGVAFQEKKALGPCQGAKAWLGEGPGGGRLSHPVARAVP